LRASGEMRQREFGGDGRAPENLPLPLRSAERIFLAPVSREPVSILTGVVPAREFGEPMRPTLVPMRRYVVPTLGIRVPTQRNRVPTFKDRVPTRKWSVPTLERRVPMPRMRVPTEKWHSPVDEWHSSETKWHLPTPKRAAPTKNCACRQGGGLFARPPSNFLLPLIHAGGCLGEASLLPTSRIGLPLLPIR
jgi:hypothetical protein